MAVRFELTGDTLRLTQTRRGLRLTLGILLVMGMLGIPLVFFIARAEFPTTLTCDHASGACTLTVGRNAQPIPIASIRSVRLVAGAGEEHASWIDLRSAVSRSLCGARDAAGEAAARSFASDVNAFLADPAHPPIEVHCVTREMAGGAPPLVAIPCSVLGWVVVFLLAAPWTDEVTTVIDRRGGTIASKGRGWLRRAWNVERPLADVAGIEVASRYVGYGQKRYLVYAVFRDGPAVLLWSPAYARNDTIDERVAAMRALCEQARKDA